MTRKEIENVKSVMCRISECAHCPFYIFAEIGHDKPTYICNHITRCNKYTGEYVQKLSKIVTEAISFIDTETLEYIIDRNKNISNIQLNEKRFSFTDAIDIIVNSLSRPVLQ